MEGATCCQGEAQSDPPQRAALGTTRSPLSRASFETQSRRGAARAQWPKRALPALLQGSCACAAGETSSAHDGSGAGSSSASGTGSSSPIGAGNVAAGARRSAGAAAMTSALENYINRILLPSGAVGAAGRGLSSAGGEAGCGLTVPCGRGSSRCSGLSWFVTDRMGGLRGPGGLQCCPLVCYL